MGRPVKNNCDYFPHFTTMRNHKKVKALRAKFGQVLGYAFWSMILEYLTEQDGIEFENSDLEIEMFAGELGVSATEIRDMIDYCIKIELLFLTEDNFIYSDSLNELLQPVFEKRKRAKELSKTRKRHNNGSYCNNDTTTCGVSVTEIPQSKVNKSKEEIIKEEKKKTSFDFSNFDENFIEHVNSWLEYKKERKEPYKSQKGLNAFYNKLIDFSKNDPDTAKKIIEQSMANNWAGIFELKESQQKNKDPFYREPIVDRTHGFSVQF